MKYVRDSLQLLRDMIRSPLTVLVMCIIPLGFLLFSIWFPIREFLWYMFTESELTGSAKIRVLLSSLRGIETNFTSLSRALLIISAVLTGLVLGALTLYLSNRITLERQLGSSAIGIIASVVGIGCASCGSIILTSLFGIGALSFTAALPLHGVEFSIIGILLLLYSFTSIANKYANPLACKITK